MSYVDDPLLLTHKSLCVALFRFKTSKFSDLAKENNMTVFENNLCSRFYENRPIVIIFLILCNLFTFFSIVLIQLLIFHLKCLQMCPKCVKKCFQKNSFRHNGPKMGTMWKIGKIFQKKNKRFTCNLLELIFHVSSSYELSYFNEVQLFISYPLVPCLGRNKNKTII